MIRAEAFQLSGRNLLRTQPAVFLAQSGKLASVGVCSLEHDAQIHRLPPLDRQCRPARHEYSCDCERKNEKGASVHLILIRSSAQTAKPTSISGRRRLRRLARVVGWEASKFEWTRARWGLRRRSVGIIAVSMPKRLDAL